MNSMLHKVILGLLSSALVFGIRALPVSAATLSFAAPTDTWSIDGSGVVEVKLSSDGQVINAMHGIIAYPSDWVEVMSISHGNSVFTLWPEEPKFDATAGLITFSAGLPNGSYVDTGDVLTLVVRAKQAGSIQFKFIADQTAVYLNDGFATPTALSFAEPVYESVEALTNELIVTSTTHPNADSWYPATIFTAEWQKKIDAVYSAQLAEQPDQPLDDMPDDSTTSDTIGQYSVADLSDGVHYFMLKEKISEEAGWSEPVVRTVLVDSIPPLSFSTTLVTTQNEFNGNPFLVFNAVDTTSGVDHYVVTELDHSTVIPNGPYQLVNPASAGVITIEAVDKAGNSTTSTIEHIGYAEPVSNSWITIVFILLILGVAAVLMIGIGRLIWRRRHPIA